VHELSLALEVCRLATGILERQGGASVRAVGVEIGADAGVEAENFRFCLETLLLEPPLSGARAVLLPVPGDDLRLAYVEVDDGGSDDHGT
jgi:Zn finger protein HypA/HybF involved in hydrogenase expression